MSLATVGGAAVTRGTVQFPAWGAWVLDAELTGDPGLGVGDDVAAEWGGVALSGHVVASGSDGGSRYGVRLVGGSGGWADAVRAAAYRNDAGVGAASVLTGLARQVGESISVEGSVATKRLGAHYARAAGSAFAALAALVGSEWYVREDGTTVTRARTEAPYRGDAVVMSRDPHARTVTLDAGSDFSGLVPGAAVGADVLGDVEWQITPSRALVVAAVGARGNRRVEALRSLFESFDPRRRYRAAYDVRLIAQLGDTADVQPVRSSSGLPPLTGVPLRLPPGYGATLTPGAICALAFADGDPSRPYIFAGDYAASPAAGFLTLQLGGPAGLPIAYQGSVVTVDPNTGIGTVTVGSLRAKVSP